MPEVPRYPGQEPGSTPSGSDGQLTPGGSRRSMYLWWAIGVGVVVLFLVLHLTGVLGPGGH